MNPKYSLCAGLLAGTAALIAFPALWVWVEWGTRPPESVTEGRLAAWVYLLTATALGQALFAAYVIQLRHPAALNVVAGFTAVLAGLAAVLLGGTLFGRATSWAPLLLQIRNARPEASGPRISFAAVWCFVILCVEIGLSVWSAWSAQSILARQRLDAADEQLRQLDLKP